MYFEGVCNKQLKKKIRLCMSLNVMVLSSVMSACDNTENRWTGLQEISIPQNSTKTGTGMNIPHSSSG